MEGKRMKKWYEEASELTAEIKQLAERRGVSLPDLSLGGTVCYGAQIAHLLRVRDSLLNPIEELTRDVYIHSDGGTASIIPGPSGVPLDTHPKLGYK